MKSEIQTVLTLFYEVLQRSSCFQTPGLLCIFDTRVYVRRYSESTKITLSVYNILIVIVNFAVNFQITNKLHTDHKNSPTTIELSLNKLTLNKSTH